MAKIEADTPLRHDFGTPDLSASVLAQGAELCALRDGDGADYLWGAGPAWPRHAPVLFPIVGRLAGDSLLHEGSRYPMNQHGFARDLAFDWLSRTDDGCVLALSDSPETRSRYPFSFRLEIAYTARGALLKMTFRVINKGNEVLPFSFGAHPAFRWPLRTATPKEAYSLTFDREETGKLPRLTGGLLNPADKDNPVFDRRMALRESLFSEDALIFPSVASRSIQFAAEGEAGLTISWEGFEQLGIWSRAGGDFVCLEPWCGFASPIGFDDEFLEKPGIIKLSPGAVRTAAVRIEVKT